MPRLPMPSVATATVWPHVSIRSPFRRLTHRLCIGIGVLGIGGFAGVLARAADSRHAALDAFSGEWKGELRVFALDGFLLRTFPAHRYYNWNGEAQVVVTRFFDGASDYETKATQTIDAGRLTATVSRPGQASEEYTGALEAGAVVWTNTSNNKRDYSERLVTTNGVTRLETTSSEIMRVKGVSGVVRVTGSFQRNDTTASLGAVPAPAGAAARIAELERELAASRQIAATAAQASAATQSELTNEGAALRVRIAQMETERAGLATRAAAAMSATARLVELEQSVATARHDTAVAQDAAIAAAAQAASLRDRVAALETQLRETEAALATFRADAADNSGQKVLLAQRDSELADVRARLERLGTDLAANQRQLDQARAEQSTAATNAAAIAAELNRARTAAAAAEAASRTAMSVSGDTERERLALREHVAKLQEELGAAHTARTQQEKDNATAAAALVTTRTETARLNARIRELETAVASAEQARAITTTAADGIARERADLQEQITALVSAAESSKTEVAKLQSERDALVARVAALATRPDVSAESLAAERRQVQERLERAERAALDFSTRLADAEQRIEVTRTSIERADAMAADLDDLRRALAAAQADATAAGRQVELLQGERDLLVSRLEGTDDALVERQSALQAAATAVAEARRRSESAEMRLQQLETADAATAGLRAELEAQLARATEREQENTRLTTRLAELERDHATLVGRLNELELTAKIDTAMLAFTLAAAPAPAVPAVSAAQRGELQAELTRLQRLVTELESERNSIRNRQTILQGQLGQARQLRDDTLARFQDVVAQLNAMREDRDRLARSAAALEAELRAVRGPGAATAAAATPAVREGPSFLERLLGYDEAAKPAPHAAAPSDEGKLPPPNAVVDARIAAFEVTGVTRAAEGDKVILNGRLHRSGDLVDPDAGIVFERTDGDALIFSDTNGREYRRRF